MNDNELLLALSEMIDKKLSAQLEPIKNDITDMKSDINDLKSDVKDLKKDMVEVKNDIVGLKTESQKVNITLENEISPSIKLLAENYLPAAIRYENSNKEHEAMKTDIELLKKVVTEHSEKLQKIS